MSSMLLNTDYYNFNIDINVNPWIKKLNVQKSSEYLNNLLNIGYNVSKSIKFQDTSNEFIDKKLNSLASISNSQLKEYKDSNDYKIDFLSQKLDNLSMTLRDNTMITRDNINKNSERVFQIVKEVTGKTNISSHKGQIGENFIFNTLDQAYPNSNLESLVSTPHQSDIHIQLENYPKIFIESKNYTNSVPKKEVIKFKNDLDRNNCEYGIFFSFNHKITGVHSRFFIENYNNKKILYVSKISFNTSEIIFPIEVMKYIIDNSEKSNKMVHIEDLSKKADAIIKVVSDLEELYSENCKNIAIVREQRTLIVKSLDLIQQNALTNLVNTKAIVEQIRDRVSKELVDFLDNKQPITKNNVDLSCYSEKTQHILNSFISILPDKYKITKNKNELECILNGDTVIKVNIGKTKIKCKILEDDCIINLNENNICKLPKYLR